MPSPTRRSILVDLVANPPAFARDHQIDAASSALDLIASANPRAAPPRRVGHALLCCAQPSRCRVSALRVSIVAAQCS